MLNRRELVAILAASAVPRFAGAASFDDPLSRLLRQRVKFQKRSVGMAACVISGKIVQIAAYGVQRAGESRLVDEETVFEIGSITKVFTALLLTDLARAGKLSINDPAASHLPGDFQLPQKDGRQITLADLATHTSGLPRFPTMTPRPYEGYPTADAFFQALAAAIKTYTLADLKSWLAQFVLPRAPGSEWEYSNMGYALLGLALAHRTDLPYDELLQRRILDPLQLRHTYVASRQPPSDRLAGSHDAALKLVPPTDSGIFTPAGSIRSTIRDLSRFMLAVMPGSHSPLEASAQLLLDTQREAALAGGKQALGWEVLAAREGEYVSKDGVTNGQCATAVYDPFARRAVVALSNTHPDLSRSNSPSGGGMGAGDIARHLLRPSIPVEA